jgi:hypothetical protein
MSKEQGPITSKIVINKERGPINPKALTIPYSKTKI